MFRTRKRIRQLELRVKQLECKHSFNFEGYIEDHYGRDKFRKIYHKCGLCNKTMIKRWGAVAKKGQQAMKLLNLVPRDWEVK